MSRSSHMIALVFPTMFFWSACSTPPKDNPFKNLTSEQRAAMIVDSAEGAINEGDPTGALHVLLEAEKLAPNMPRLHLARGLAMYAKKDITAAIIHTRRAVELSKRYPEAWNTLGKFLMEVGGTEEAETYLIQAAAEPLFRSSFKAHTNLGILYYRQGKYTKARDHFDRAVIDSAENACIAHFYRGHLHTRKGDVRSSIRDYGLATRGMCASFSDAHIALALALEKDGRTDAARRKYLEIQKFFPNSKVADQAMDRLRNLP